MGRRRGQQKRWTTCTVLPTRTAHARGISVTTLTNCPKQLEHLSLCALACVEIVEISLGIPHCPERPITDKKITSLLCISSQASAGSGHSARARTPQACVGPPALTMRIHHPVLDMGVHAPSQRTAPFPSVNTSTGTCTCTRSLGLLNFANEGSVTASLPAHRVISGARCPILPGGIVIGNQVGGGGRGELG